MRLGRWAAVLVLAGLLLGGCAEDSGRTASKPSDRLPDVTLTSLTGGDPVRLRELRGPMVINLWASWCTPCREELPKYQAFAKQYDGTVSVLGIDFQETQPDAARKLARDTGVRYPLISDPDGKLRALGLPKVILLDRDGRIAHEEYVEITSVRQLEQLVSRHLGRTLVSRGAA